ncbi:MAG: hypothetical protein ACYDGN_14420 [Acidimicrobiales bacterium]
MPVLSGAEIQQNLRAFVQRWRTYAGTERSEAQTFVNEFFAAYGENRRDAGASRLESAVASAVLTRLSTIPSPFNRQGWAAGTGRAFEVDSRRHLISDRCLIDLVAYGRANEAMVDNRFPPHFIDAIQQIAISSCQA